MMMMMMFSLVWKAFGNGVEYKIESYLEKTVIKHVSSWQLVFNLHIGTTW